MGNPIQKLTENVSLIASEETWIEGLAIQQLEKTAELAGMHSVAGMPDLHPGKGYPIGAAFFSQKQLYPALVGNDIGCGMALWQTDLRTGKVNIEKLMKRLNDVESPLDDSWRDFVQERKQQKNISHDLFDSSLGTIGGGNHFAEFQQVTDIYEETKFDALGLDARQLQLLIHSGSRGLGQSILTSHVQQFNHNGLCDDSSSQQDYLHAHNEALRWAELNREMIARRFLKAIRAAGQCHLDVNHNLVESKTIGLTKGWLHRKGATPSDKGAVMIPGSRGDYSWLVMPTDADAALYSLAHGAGRKWKRGDCKARLSHKYKRDDMLKTRFGSRVICGDKELLYDEAPQAYKDSTSIIEALTDAGLLTVIARLKPVLTFKTTGGCRS